MNPRRTTWIIILLAALLKLSLVLAHQGHLGVDGGAYLLSAASPGADNGLDYHRPPLAPGFMLKPFLGAFGLELGFDIFSVVGSMFLLGPALLITRRLLAPWPACAAMALISFDFVHMDMLVTGALPLIAFTYLAGIVWALVQLWERRPPKLPAAIIAVGIPLIAYTNTTTAGITAVSLPLLVVALTVIYHRLPSRWIVGSTLVGLLGAATAFGYYDGSVPGGDATKFEGPWLYPSKPGDFVWCQLIAGCSVGILALRYGNRTAKAFASYLVILSLLAPWLSNDEAIINISYRSGYLQPLFLWPLVVWAAHRWLWAAMWPAVRILAPSTAILALAVASVWTFWAQSNISDMLTPDALKMVEKVDGEGAVITNSFTMSLWLAALGREQVLWTFSTNPPKRWRESDEHVRCVMGWRLGCDPTASAHAIDAAYILVDARWQEDLRHGNPVYGAPSLNPWEKMEAEWLVPVASAGSVHLWRVSR